MRRFCRIILLLFLLGCPLLTIIPVQAEITVAAPVPDNKTNLVLNLLPGSYYDRIPAGEETQLFMEIRNQGDITITGIRFDASLPKGWSVRYVPPELAALTKGSSNTIEAFITPAAHTGRGVNVTFIAVADQTRAVTSAYFNVESGSNLWLWVGLGLGVIVIVGFILVFLRQGK
jgi:uncharacterized membrane protein